MWDVEPMKIKLITPKPMFPCEGANVVRITAIKMGIKTIIVDMKNIQSMPNLNKMVKSIASAKKENTKQALMQQIANGPEEMYGPSLAQYMLANRPDITTAASDFIKTVQNYKVLDNSNNRIKVTDAFECIEFQVVDTDLPKQTLYITNTAVLLGVYEQAFPEWAQMSIQERTAAYPNGYPINSMSELVGKELILYYYVKENKNNPTHPYRDWWVREK
jgi:hypothetical protein